MSEIERDAGTVGRRVRDLARRRIASRIVVAAAALALASPSEAQPAAAEAEPTLDRADAALVVAEARGIAPTSDRQDLHGLFNRGFPGGYDGLTSLSFHDRPATLEVMIVVAVWIAGWDVLHYDAALAEVVRPFASPEGFPYYGPDPTPRSIPFLCVAIERGLLDRADLARLHDGLTRSQIRALFADLDRIEQRVEGVPPFVVAPPTLGRGVPVEDVVRSGRQVLVLPPGMPLGHFAALDSFTSPVLDLRGPGPRLSSGPTRSSHGLQSYFPLGALATVFETDLAISPSALYHQGQAFHARVENSSTTVNAVGLWGTAASAVRGARVWGGFLDVTSGNGPDNDGQLIGLEVDVSNASLPGIHPNESKVGIQVVGLGTAANTNAIEIIAADRGQWTNGILFSTNSIGTDGTFIASSHPGTVNIGIDYSHTTFRRAGILLGNQARLEFLGPSSGDPSGRIFVDSREGGALVLEGGRGGIRLRDSTDSRSLLWLHDDGTIDARSTIVRRYRWIAYSTTGVVVVLLVALGLLIRAHLRLARTVTELARRVPEPRPPA